MILIHPKQYPHVTLLIYFSTYPSGLNPPHSGATNFGHYVTNGTCMFFFKWEPY
jgi:hypothetical protein